MDNLAALFLFCRFVFVFRTAQCRMKVPVHPKSRYITHGNRSVQQCAQVEAAQRCRSCLVQETVLSGRPRGGIAAQPESAPASGGRREDAWRCCAAPLLLRLLCLLLLWLLLRLLGDDVMVVGVLGASVSLVLAWLVWCVLL